LNLSGDNPTNSATLTLSECGGMPDALTETDLRAASAAGVLEAAQLHRLIAFLRQRGTPTQRHPRRASMSRACSGTPARSS
jgi:hypothetical protein